MNSYADIFHRGLGSKSKSKIKIDTTLPKLLWDIDKFTETRTSLTELYDKKLEITSIENKISIEREKLGDDMRKYTSQRHGELSSIISDINQEKSIKTEIFKNKKRMLVQEKENAINMANREYEDKKNMLIMTKEKNYKKALSGYHSLINRIDGILDRYNAKVRTDIDLNISRKKIEPLTYIDIEDLIDKIENAILNALETSVVAKMPYDKIKEMNKKQDKLALTAATVLTFINPIIPLASAGVLAGATILGSGKAKKEVSELLERLIYIKQICIIKYQIAKKDNTIDINPLKEELDKTLKDAEDDYNEGIERLESEQKEWEEDYKRRCNIDYETEFSKETNSYMQSMTDRYNEKINSLNEQLKYVQDEYDRLQKRLEEDNGSVKIVDFGNEEIFKKIKETNDIVSKFYKYNNLKELHFNLDDEPNASKEKLAQITYDRELYENEYLPLKAEIQAYEKEGKDMEYWKDKLAEHYREEDKYYLISTNGLHLGSLKQSDNYSILSEHQEVFSKDWDNNSILVFYKDEFEEEVLVNYIKYLILQIVGKSIPDGITVNIVNPTVDTKFNDILLTVYKVDDDGDLKKVKDAITNYSEKDINDLINAQKAYVSGLIEKELSGGKTIHEVIKDKRKRFSKAPGIFLNVLHRCEMNNPLLTLSENSDVTGVINICLIKEDFISNKKLDNGLEVPTIPDNIKYKLGKTPIMLYLNKNTNNQVLNVATKDGKITQIKLKKSYMDTRAVLKGIEKRILTASKQKTFTLVNEFISDTRKPEDIWTQSALETLRLYFGYVDGDKSKPLPIVLDETSKVHMMLCGTTGGGKSVTLNFMNEVLKVDYPPSELEIVYYDFKKVEVALHTKPYKWVNASALSASETGDYFISLLKYLQNEMNTRYDNCQKMGTNKLSSYRKKLMGIKKKLIAEGKLEQAAKVEIPPRMLAIFDEFQGAFDISDEVTEQARAIIEDLARKSRAAGLHMLIVTQDPTGAKIPEAVLNLFTQRACTIATKGVSMAVMRNDFCSRPENQFVGFLGTNTTGGTEEGNRQYVVPFAQESWARFYSKYTNDLLGREEFSNERSRDAVTFNEDESLSFDKLDEMIENHWESKGDIILGKKVEFQLEEVPAKIKLYPDMMENISFISANTEAKVEFYKTIMKSIAKDKDARVITFFPKDYDPQYETEELTKNTQFYLPVYKNSKTGQVAYNAFNMGITNGDLEDPESGWTMEELPAKYFDGSRYTKALKRGEERADETMNGYYTFLLQGYIEAAEEAKRNGEIPVTRYIIIIDPERDPYIRTEHLWANKEFEQLANEAASNDIHTIMITSKYDRMVTLPYFRWRIGKTVGMEASTDKIFKKLEKNLTKINNTGDTSKSFKAVMPVTNVDTRFPWEF